MNAPKVAAELIDDETIVINFETGAYHSLRGVASHAWSILATTVTLETLVAGISAYYDGDEDHIRDALQNFVDELAAAGLVVMDAAEPASQPVQLPASPNGRPRFQPPVMETFADMQDYLLMDPIHEVDSTGWPNALPEGGNGQSDG